MPFYVMAPKQIWTGRGTVRSQHEFTVRRPCPATGFRSPIAAKREFITRERIKGVKGDIAKWRREKEARTADDETIERLFASVERAKGVRVLHAFCKLKYGWTFDIRDPSKPKGKF
jgi:hypothetical protein